jgi:hypothetical protein
MSVMAPLLGAIVLVGCSTGTDQDDPPVARAYDQYLRWSDLRQVVPMDAAAEDSAAMAQAYIDNWLQQQVELHHAESNLAPSEKEFEAELRDYRNSLLMIAFEDALVRQRLDTVISEQELQAYYEANRAAFDLTEDILRARWFKLDGVEPRTVKRLEERFLSGKPELMREVEIGLAEKGVSIIDRTSLWMTASELRNEVPLDQLPAVGPDGKRLIIRSDSTVWFLDVVELRSRHAAAPIELVRQRIRTGLLNQRKLSLIETMRKDLFKEATQAKDVEAY